jgi:hypothetical protein
MINKRRIYLEITLDSVHRVHIPKPTRNVIEKPNDASDRRQIHC